MNTDIGELLNPMPTLPATYTGADAAQRLEHLRTRLGERDVTVEEVWDYLILNHQPPINMQMQQLASFVSQDDLGHFWWLYDWWAPVEKKPQNLPTPSIQQFCWSVNYIPGTEPITFNGALQAHYQKCIAYLQANNMDTVRPGESVDDRRRRLNRERMAATRAHRKVPDRVLKDNEPLSQQVRELERQREQLKEDAKDTDELLAAETKRHMTAMNDAAQRRRDAKADFKERIQNLSAEIAQLIAKQ